VALKEEQGPSVEQGVVVNEQLTPSLSLSPVCCHLFQHMEVVLKQLLGEKLRFLSDSNLNETGNQTFVLEFLNECNI